MVTIDLNLFATLAAYLPETPDPYQVEEGTTAGDLVELLGIPKDQVKLIFINNVRKKRDTILKDNDRVGIFPPVGGG